MMRPSSSKENTLALDSEYVVTAGIVQQFGDKDVADDREVNESNVRSFAIKTITAQGLVRVSLWDELSEVEVSKGMLVGVDGKYSVSDDGQYHNVSATSISTPNGVFVRPPREGGSTKKSQPKGETKGEKAPF